MIRKLLDFLQEIIRVHRWTLTLFAVTGILCALVVYLIVWPAYRNPISRMYTSKLGYAAVIRRTGGAFPVDAARAEIREIIGKHIGEGLVQSEPIQVPLVAMSRIIKVHVDEGQRVKKGEVIVELDHSRLDLKIASARAVLETARAELDRVRLGTVNVLQEERPDLLLLRSEAAKAEADLAAQILNINRQLNDQKAISQVELAKSRLASIQADLMLRGREIATDVAREGRESSVRIAESAIREAEMTLAYRLSEQADYVSLSPADGIVERVLVHEGEYNQDPGRPAVLLASGLWFECYLDQTSLGKVAVSDHVEVRLGAYQDRIFPGAIERVRPLVNFALGGPETNRPIRPLGTGAPEWPATFAVRVQLDANDALVVPGLTGYATVVQKRKTLSVPRGTVSAVSGNRGIVFVVGSDRSTFEPRNVVTGITDHHWVEIREGLDDGDIVVVDGYQILKPGDSIAINNAAEIWISPLNHPQDAGRGESVRLVGASKPATGIQRRRKGAADDRESP